MKIRCTIPLFIGLFGLFSTILAAPTDSANTCPTTLPNSRDLPQGWNRYCPSLCPQYANPLVFAYAYWQRSDTQPNVGTLVCGYSAASTYNKIEITPQKGLVFTPEVSQATQWFNATVLTYTCTQAPPQKCPFYFAS